MKRKSIKIAGIIILIFTLVANLQYALFNYGIKNANIGQQVFAQSTGGEDVAVAPGSSSGGNTNSGGSSSSEGSTTSANGGCYIRTQVACTIWGPSRFDCGFTGVYGAPYACDWTTCLYSYGERKCVQKK